MIQVRNSNICFDKIIVVFIDVVISSDDNPDLLRIPLLKDVFERYPTTSINIDIKENNDELIKLVKSRLRF
jgi:hypothetical protein